MNELILGSWNVICDRCGVKRKAHQVRETWDHFIVCAPEIKQGCWEPRHPQDFVRSKPDDQRVAFTRPEPATDLTIEPDYIDESVGTQENTKPAGTFDNSL